MKIYTIRDIAEMAHVSVTTVSRVLNDRPDVSRETKERVRRVMAECHFVGNANARGLKQADGESVALIIRGRNNPFLNALTETMLRCPRREKTALLTEYIDERDDEFLRALTLLNRQRIAGLIFLGSRIDQRCEVLNGVTVPMMFATVSTEGTAMERASSVTMDDREMARQAVEALLARGHEQIAVFGGRRTGDDSLVLRALGAEDALRSHGKALDEAHYVETRLTLQDAYESGLAFFRRSQRADAAFCMSDTVALGVMRALTDLGRRVPQDVSVIGVDGVEIGRYTIPRLSTVVQPVEEIARDSMAVLRDMMENHAPARHITLKGKLEIRESVRD
ncbi:MAG: LacI family DNA-binding transcriptional regulator [Clostridia bacterium]|nr:LacI family DNA-binding transcriptional regulator [Clostridia bacterium]